MEEKIFRNKFGDKGKWICPLSKFPTACNKFSSLPLCCVYEAVDTDSDSRASGYVSLIHYDHKWKLHAEQPFCCPKIVILLMQCWSLSDIYSLPARDPIYGLLDMKTESQFHDKPNFRRNLLGLTQINESGTNKLSAGLIKTSS